MSKLLELRQWRSADALSRRIRAGEFRMRAFELLQFAKQPVVLGIAHQRLVEHIVLTVMQFQFRAQFLRPRQCGFRYGHYENRRSASGLPAGIPCCSMLA